MRRFKGIGGAAALTAIVVLLAGGLAWADGALADGDGAVPLSARALTIGDVCANSTVTKDVLVGIVRTQGNSGFKNSTSVTMSVVSATGSGLSAAMRVPQPTGSSNPFTVPSTFEGSTSGTTAGPASSRVTFVAGAAGSTLSGSVVYRATGIKASNGTVFTEDTTMSVSATVVVCDSTPPTLNLPTSKSAEATGPSGAAVAFSATATDANPISPAVTCLPSSGATFALGTTTVSCSATDTAGNTATGTFPVTVQDTTGPAMSAASDIEAEATGGSGATVTFTAPTATDLVDGPRPVTCAPASGSVLPIGANPITCSASDTRGNGATTGFTVTVADSTEPTLVVPGTITVEATGPDGATATYAASATDVVDGVITPTCAPASGAEFALGTTEVTCTAADSRGNSTSSSFDVKVVDTTAPTLEVPASSTVEATGPSGAGLDYTASAHDLVDGTLPASCSTPSGSTLPLGATTVTCTATDAQGNTGTAAFTVTVVDTSPPTLHLPADVIVEADGPTGKVVSFTATADDLVDGTVAVSCAPPSGSAFAVGVHTVTCSAADVRGNEATGAISVTVTDTTAPEVTAPDDIVAEATSADGAPVDFAATADDIVSGALDVTCDPASGSTFALGTTEVTCTATDDAANTGTATFSVEVVDTTAPAIAGTPDDLEIEAQGPDGAVVSYDPPTATDVVDGNVAVTCLPAPGDTFELDVATTVTCTATDAHDNTATSTFEVLVSDGTAPALTLPSDIVEEATGPNGAAVSWTASADDIVDGDVPVACDPSSGATFPLARTVVACSATDARGNTGSGSFAVTVVDTTPPVLTLPDPITTEATGPTGASVAFEATALDIVDGDVAAVCSSSTGDTFPLGTSTVDCTATDEAGNTGTGSFSVTVEDTTAPDLTLPAAITVEATGPLGATVTYDVTADDLVSGVVLPSCTPAPGVFPLGTTTVECSATDGAGNTGTGSFDITVQDTTAPDLTLPDEIVAEATGPGGAPVTWTATATDVVDGTVTPSCTPSSGSTFALGDTPVECTATDAAGNATSDSFTVTVEDTTAPTIADTPTDLVQEAAGAEGAVVTFTDPTATDLVDGSVAVSCTPPSGSSFALDVATTVTCTAADTRGNSASTNFTVEVHDTTAPTLTLPDSVSAEATGPDGAVVPFTTSAADAVDGAVAVLCSPPSSSQFELGTTSVGCSATDGHGNASSGGFTVTVVDTTAPVLTLPANIVIEATGPAGATVPFSVSAHDVVDGPLDPTCSRDGGDTFVLGITTITCSISDAHGNATGGSFAVTVKDTTAPALTVPGPIAAMASGASGAKVNFNVSAHDIVDGAVPVSCTPASGTTFGAGLHSVSCRATDVHLNTGAGSFTVTVRFDLGSGFLQPVDPRALNVVKGGSTVPLKWTVRTASGGEITSLSVVSGFLLTQVRCEALGAAIEEVALAPTGGTTLRSSGGQFIYNWQTPKKPGACYRADVIFVGGLQRLSATFQLK